MSYLQNYRGSGSFEDGSSVGDEETLTPHEAYEIERERTLQQQPPYVEPQQQLEDYESQPDVSPPDASSSTAIFWTKPRKLIAGISLIALVAGAAVVGVGLSSKQSSSPANRQPLVEDVVIADNVGDAPPSIAEDTTAEPVAVEPAAELISTEIVDDGIIYDFAAQQEVTTEEPKFDLDVVEFKGDLSDFIDTDVARLSVDADDEDCNSEGALWEFEFSVDNYPWEMSWSLLRSEGSEKTLWAHGPPKKTAYNRLTKYRGKLCLPPGGYEMKITDSEGDGACCAYGIGGYRITVSEAVVAESNMLEDDPFYERNHEFSIKPKEETTTTTTTATTTTAAAAEDFCTEDYKPVCGEDGNTHSNACKAGLANVAIAYDGECVKPTTTSAPEPESTPTTTTQDSTEDPTESPSSEPSMTPTQVPSSSPSLKPTPLPTPEPTPKAESSENEGCRNPNVIVGIEILTDGKGFHTGYTFTGDSGTLKERATGSMSSNTKYLDEICVRPGTYELNMVDTSGNGIRSPGYVAVYLDKEKIMQDFTFNTAERLFTIKAGFSPTTTETERKWLDGHNEARKEFHEANGLNFRPLAWSPAAANSASAWATKIVGDQCALSREPSLNYGELTFAMITGNAYAALTEPEKILNRWYHAKVDYSKPSLVDDDDIPGLAFTQVTWVSSRYLGCAYESGPLSGGKYCHVVICRYATSGNCNMRMKAGQWKAPTLADKSICTSPCPSGEGCH